MRCEWDTVTLKDVLGGKGYVRGPFGSALKRNELLSTGPYAVYEQQHAIYGDRCFRFYIDSSRYEKLKRFTVKENDLIISCSGTIGRVSMIRKNDPNGIISQALLILRADTKKISPHYLFHFIKSTKGYNAITSRSSGSVQVNIAKREVIEGISFSLPSLSEQHAIAVTLSCLDDKIELNNKINQNLEAQAQALFKSWFVDFEPFQNGEFVDSELGKIPKGWTVGVLSEIANITMGQSPNGSSYNEVAEGTVFYQGRAEFGWRFPTIRLHTTEPKRMAYTGDVLMSVRAPVGDINIAMEDCCIGRGLAAIRSNTSTQSYILYLLFELKKQFDVFNSEGTVFGSINQKDLKSLKIIIPPVKIMEKYNHIASGFDSKIENLSKQNRKLAAIRDALLPKLMSGEIQVPV